MTLQTFINLSYILAAILFMLGLKQLGSPATARRGNMISAVGMLLAVVVTLLSELKLPWENILLGLIIGSLIGGFAASKVEMTSMPELVAIFNGLGGAASLLVGWVALFPVTIDVVEGQAVVSPLAAVAIVLSVMIGGLTVSGSLIAYGKLSERMSTEALTFRGQQLLNSALVLALLACAVLFVLNPSPSDPVFWALIALSLLFGIMSVIPIGGADMPVVIALLNSYSGLAACAAGFVLNNNLLIVSGALVGASGIILTNIMCKAMNRSLANVLFSGFAQVKQSASAVEGEPKPISAEDAFLIAEAAQRIVIVPGYGMAVAQAQHVVKELADHMEANGAEVKFAIHPVAGRMPGHMNVLLAEASVPYDQLVEMDEINPQLPATDLAIVIGANDVVNPAANEDPASPLYGMPVINVSEARTVFVLKRSMKAGYAGVDNPLFVAENTRMLFGDAKQSLSTLVSEFVS